MEIETTTQTENTANQAGDTSTVNEGDKLFTQEEVNKFLQKRVKEVKKQFEGFDDLKNQVADLTEKLKQYQEKTKELQTKYSETVFNSVLESSAKELNLDVTLATKLLDRDKIIVVEEKPSNIKELLQALITEHPNLVKRQASTPTVVATQQTEQLSLYKKPNSTAFFNGGGLRLNNIFKDNI